MKKNNAIITEDNTPKNLKKLLSQNKIKQYEYNFRMIANNLNIKTYKIFEL